MNKSTRDFRLKDKEGKGSNSASRYSYTRIRGNSLKLQNHDSLKDINKSSYSYTLIDIASEFV